MKVRKRASVEDAATHALDDRADAVANAEALEDAYGRTRARLKLTPEMIARSMEQVRRGEFVPAGELRDELRTRLRA